MTSWNLRRPPGPDPLTVVEGLNGCTYPCPDISTLDAHLAELADRLRHAVPRFPDLARTFRYEIDRLLDRRIWLGLETTADPQAAAA